MSKELANQDANFAGQLAAATATQAQATGEVAFMKFSKGEWSFGASEEEPSEGSLWAVNIKSFLHGYIIWDDGELVEEVMTPLGTPQSPIPAEHIQRAAEESEYSANPQVAFSMLCIEGEEKGTVVLFSTSSVGGRKAVAKMLKKVTKEATAGNPYVAVVSLSAESYKHKKFGKVYNPLIEVSEFISEADLAGYLSDAAEDEPEEVAKPSKSKRAEKQADIEDEVPFEEDEDEQEEEKPAPRRRRNAR